MKNMKVEDAVKLGKVEFAQWVAVAPTAELDKVFASCSFNTHAAYQRRWVERL